MTIELRPVRDSDRPRIEEISAQIWDGEDYVASVLDAWLADETGEVVGAEIDGTLIAFARRTWICPGHAWLEGIRTDPAYRGRGAGRAITGYLIDSARRAGACRIHLSTHVDNEASIHIIESFGFGRVASFAFLETDSPPLNEKPEETVDITHIDLAETTAFVDRSDFLAVARRQFPHGWRFFPFDTDGSAATAHLATRLGIRRHGELVALACVRQPIGETGPVTLNFADGEPADLRRLLDVIHRQYAGRHIEAMVPKTADREARLLAVLREAGYASWDDYCAAIFVYEMLL